ncbi:MAG: hypothetical protein ACK8QZ_00875 [Anaerolineales bacterium]
MNAPLEVGRLLRAGTRGFVAGCRISQFEAPAFGALVRVPLKSGEEIYGLIHDIQIADDGLVRQLVTSEHVSDEVMRDNRERRIVPVEMSVLSIGYAQGDQIYYLLPPRPPLSLDLIYLCSREETRRFTTGNFGYFRHILRARELPIGELLASHLQHTAPTHPNPQEWLQKAIQEIIILLRDDYSTLMAVLNALREVVQP